MREHSEPQKSVRVGLEPAPISSTHAKIGMRLDYHMTFVWDADKLSEFAKVMGWSNPVMQKVVKGTREITLSELQAMARYFGTTLQKVIEGNF